MKKYILLCAAVMSAFIIVLFSSCADNPITQIFFNEVTAKQRLDSANAQAVRKYGANTKLVLIMGKNVKSNGTTDISTLSAITSPDSIGAWLYVYCVPADTSLRVYTPNPIPGANDCIELTAFFNVNTLLALIPDTSSRNIISGALNLVTQANISITTSSSELIDSDVSLGLANSTSPVIKFNSNYIPASSNLNGNLFFSTGTNKSINVFLIPAAGTLQLPNYIQNLIGFPADLWIVNYKKTDSGEKNLILGTVVKSNQIMGISSLGLSSKVINLSKFVQENP
jgi:hypothetical protein